MQSATHGDPDTEVGVFTLSAITKGTAVVNYVGQVGHKKQYPEDSRYCARLGCY